MSFAADPGPLELDAPVAPPEASRARAALVRRLSDIVGLPSTAITPHQRSMAGDMLIELLRVSDERTRERCAERIAALAEAPSPLIRMLAKDAAPIARIILAESKALSLSDLLHVVRSGRPEHRVLIAKRRAVDPVVSAALAEFAEPPVLNALLNNKGAELSFDAVEHLIAISRDNTGVANALARRAELEPGQAFTLFWWTDWEGRRMILRRYASSRDVFHESVDDLFHKARKESWQDAPSRKVLQFIDRRQRNRAAIDKSPYDSLEHACEIASAGIDRKLVEELSYLAGLKPPTGAQIFTDPGGEGLAVYCKATGLGRDSLEQLWRGLKRPLGTLAQPDAQWDRVRTAYDLMAVDPAQTILRYWNWSLTSELSADLIRSARAGAPSDDEADSPARRAAALVFGRS
ncbi:MAG: DUF2336 domain-containing protein [Maricaulaceae bacterium]